MVTAALTFLVTGALSAQRELVLLRSPASVRIAGMNGVGTAMMGDAGAVFTNPAGLATIRNVALESSYRTTPLDGYMVLGALAWRLKQLNFGAGLQYFDRGVLLANRLDSAVAAPASSQKSYEWLAVGSLIYRYGLIAFGGSVKAARQQAEGVQRRATGVDAGLTLAVFDIMALGFAVQNIGGNLRADSDLELPKLSRFGFTMNYVDPQETLRLLSSIEVQWPEGRESRVVLGIEGGVVISGVGVKGRLGWGGSELGDRTNFTFGASLDIGRTNVDFSSERESLLGETAQRIGVRIRL